MHILNNKFKQYIPGIILMGCLAVPAWYGGKAFPLVGGPVLGILLGMLLAFWSRPVIFNEGIRYTSRKLLQAAIIMLGFEMNLYNVLAVGRQSLAVMLFTLSVSFITAWLVGRSLKIAGNTATLIGVGTAICGGSAIAATAPVIRAEDKEVAYAISTIFLFNILAVFIFPMTGHIMKMGDAGFGMWAGTAINDTSSVVAAAYSYSNAAGNFATIVKLARTLMIVPVTLVLGIYTSRKFADNNQFSISKVFPWFVVGFILTSIINTVGIITPATSHIMAEIGKFLIIMAMLAIGINTNIKNLLSHGIKPILLGLSCWAAVAFTSLAVQYFLHMW